MGNLLREASQWKPSPEWLAKAKDDAKKNRYCSACKHFRYDASIPGFVTYYGDCDIGGVVMPNKGCRLWEEREE